MRSPYEIYEAIHGAYDPDVPREIVFSVWLGERKAAYLAERPEARKNMVDGNFYESELQRFFEWLDSKFTGGADDAKT